MQQAELAFGAVEFLGVKTLEQGIDSSRDGGAFILERKEQNGRYGLGKRGFCRERNFHGQKYKCGFATRQRAALRLLITQD